MSVPQPPGIPEPPPETSPLRVTKRARRKAQPSAWQPVLYLKMTLLLLVIAYSIAFVVENSKQINIHFVFATAKVRLIWALLLVLAIGVVGGILLSQLHRHRRRAQLAKKSGKSRHARPDVLDRDEAVGKPS